MHQDGFSSPIFSWHLRTVFPPRSDCSRVASLAATEACLGSVLVDRPQSCLQACEKKE